MTTIEYQLARSPGEAPSGPWHIAPVGSDIPLCHPPVMLTDPERRSIELLEDLTVCSSCRMAYEQLAYRE